MQIVIIGAGNLANCISAEIINGGHSISQVIAKNDRSAKAFAALIGSDYGTNLQAINSTADLYLIATPDSSIDDIIHELPVLNGIIVHCSGGSSINVLRNSRARGFGVLYPFQTFTKTRKIDLRNVPIFIEADNRQTLEIIRNLANSLSNIVHEVDSETRAWIHLSGVFSNNFVNHMLKISSQILENNTISNEILKPLLSETINKAFILGPANSQTGPAIRNDVLTINKHIKMLNQIDPELAKIYKELSLSIQSTK